MRIDLNSGAELFPEVGRINNWSPSSAAGQASGDDSVGQDEAQLPGVYAQIRVLAAQVLQLPEAGEEKVSALREMVLGDSYQRGSEQVAQALLAHMLVQPPA
jgi:hypothetical protein